jgi:hypothetical protein
MLVNFFMQQGNGGEEIYRLQFVEEEVETGGGGGGADEGEDEEKKGAKVWRKQKLQRKICNSMIISCCKCH